MKRCSARNKYYIEKNSFTLVELLLVISLLALSVGITSDILVSLIRSYNKTQVANEIEQQANFVTLKIEKELRNARDVSGGGTSVSITPSVGTGTITYSVVSGVIMRGVGAAAPEAVTSNVSPGGVLVSCGIDGVGNCFDITGSVPKTVTIKLTFQQFQQTGPVDLKGKVKYQNAIVIRNTY